MLQKLFSDGTPSLSKLAKHEDAVVKAKKLSTRQVNAKRRVDKKIEKKSSKRRKKARLHKGGDIKKSFFENAGIKFEKYNPTGSLYGQTKDYTCVATSFRMTLEDLDIIRSEDFLASALETTKDGARILDISKAIANTDLYRYGLNIVAKDKLSFKDFITQFEKAEKAIVSVFTDQFGHHAIVIEKIQDGFIYIKDPLPMPNGLAYKVSMKDFKTLFAKKAVFINK